MSIEIDRVRISATGRQQLIQIKRRTHIEHFNIICRHALMMSLEEKSQPPVENYNMAGGLEIDWKVFCGGETGLYYNILLMRCLADGLVPTAENVKNLLTVHLHRGLSYLNSNSQLIFS